MAFSDDKLSAFGPTPESVSIQPRPVGTTPTGDGGYFEVGPSVEPRGTVGPEFDLPDAEDVAP